MKNILNKAILENDWHACMEYLFVKMFRWRAIIRSEFARVAIEGVIADYGRAVDAGIKGILANPYNWVVRNGRDVGFTARKGNWPDVSLRSSMDGFLICVAALEDAAVSTSGAAYALWHIAEYASACFTERDWGKRTAGGGDKKGKARRRQEAHELRKQFNARRHAGLLREKVIWKRNVQLFERFEAYHDPRFLRKGARSHRDGRMAYREWKNEFGFTLMTMRAFKTIPGFT